MIPVDQTKKGIYDGIKIVESVYGLVHQNCVPPKHSAFGLHKIFSTASSTISSIPEF
jgi:hypothetical protein